MLIIQYVTTTNDTNGNPRRGWTIHELAPGVAACHNCSNGETGISHTPDYLGYVDEGYAGARALSDQLRVAYGDERPDTVIMPDVRLRPGAHRDIRRGLWFVTYAEKREQARLYQQAHTAPPRP